MANVSSDEEDNDQPEDNNSQDDEEQEEGENGHRRDGRPEALSFTSFLFGNVDEKGQLETDFLDEVGLGSSLSFLCSILTNCHLCGLI